MAAPFSFGFAGDDIDGGENDENTTPAGAAGEESRTAVTTRSLMDVERHTLDELLSTLPSKISYSTLAITLRDGQTICIPRRELFDVRVQLMAEDDGPGTSNSTAANVLTGLGEDDIQVNVYEGGLKSWECSVDLVKVLLRDDIYSSRLFGAGAKHIVELGAGTALPTMALFQLAVTRQAQSTRFTVSDYNFDVLRLVSIPNILLSWAIAASEGHWQAESDLEITSELLERFQTDLRRRDITVDAISGAWGSPFIDALTDRPDPATRLVVASETIYSPASLDSFAEVLLGALGGAEDYTALVAAKRVYFGVGGGVAEFVRALESRGGAARQVAEEAAQGVSRVVLEIAAGRQLTRRRQEGL